MIIWTRFFEIHDYHVFKQESLWKWENMCSCFPWIIYDARYPWLRADTSFSHDPIVHGERYTWTIFRKIKRSLGVVTPRVARATIHLSFFFIVRPAVAFQIPRIRNPPYCERGNFLECYSFCVRMKERERERERSYGAFDVVFNTGHELSNVVVSIQLWQWCCQGITSRKIYM